MNPQSDCESVKTKSIFDFIRRKSLSELEVIFFGKLISGLLLMLDLPSSGFALVLGNRNFIWHRGLVFGIDAVLLNLISVGTAYVCLCLCLGEMTSALPFSGGIFGFVRAATGPYYGFIVACFEIVFCLSYLVLMTFNFMVIPVAAGAMDASFTPTLICITYGFALTLNLIGGKPFWTLVSLAGFTIFLLLIIFLAGTAVDANTTAVDFQRFCATSLPVTFKAFIEGRTLTISQYQGLQYLPLLSEFVKEPRKSIPRATVLCGILFLTFSVFVALAACSTAPGGAILQQFFTPLMFGFQRIFHTNLENGVWLHLPGLFFPTITVLYCAGRQLHMIAKSGYLPTIFTYTTPVTNTPIVTLTISAIICGWLNLYIYYHPEVFDQLVNIFVLTSHLIIINAFIAYLWFRKKYSSMPRSFINPLGIWGAWYGLLNNILGTFSVTFYAGFGSTIYTLCVLAGYFVVSTIFYWGYLVKRQKFSEDEKKLLFKAYLINANREKRNRMLRNNKVTPAGKKDCHSRNSTNLSNNRGTAGPSVSIPKEEHADCVGNASSNLATSTNSTRDAEEVQATSEKLGSVANSLLQFFSTKFNTVVPLIEDRLFSMSHEEMQEHQQLILLSAGGVIDQSQELALEERLGLHDVEAAVGNTLNDCNR